MESASPYLCAVKLSRQLVLRLGLTGVARIVDRAHSFDLPSIMDCKLNDVAHTNLALADEYFRSGFDAVTASPFVGWEGGLKPVFDLARQQGRGVLLLVYMSHPGSVEGYGQRVLDPQSGKPIDQYTVFARKALQWGADGAVVGATFPEKIREVKSILHDRVPIYSPGIGAQGGRVKEALSAGSKYLIVGRSIYLADEPAEAAAELLNLTR